MKKKGLLIAIAVALVFIVAGCVAFALFSKDSQTTQNSDNKETIVTENISAEEKTQDKENSRTDGDKGSKTDKNDTSDKGDDVKLENDDMEIMKDDSSDSENGDNTDDKTDIKNEYKDNTVTTPTENEKSDNNNGGIELPFVPAQ